MSKYAARTFRKRHLFLEALEVSESETKAARMAGEDIRFFRRWRDQDENFRKDWEDALEAGTDHLEDAATERALTKSDPLMLAMLKARRPDKFDRGNKLQLTGTINVEGSKAKLLNKLAKLRAEQARIEGAQKAEEEEQEKEGQEKAEEQKLLPAPGKPFEPGVLIVRGSKRRRQTEDSRRRDAAA